MKKTIVVAIMLVLMMVSIASAQEDMTFLNISWNDSIETVIEKLEASSVISRHQVFKLLSPVARSIIPSTADKERASKLNSIFVSPKMSKANGDFDKVIKVEFSGADDSPVRKGMVYFGVSNKKILAIKVILRNPDPSFGDILSKKYGSATTMKYDTLRWEKQGRTLYYVIVGKPALYYINEVGLAEHLDNIVKMTKAIEKKNAKDAAASSGSF